MKLISFKKYLGHAAVLVALGTILSRATGLLRIRILANFLGAGPELDAYYAAFRIPDLISSVLISGTLSIAFIPVFAKYLHTKKEIAWGLANSTIMSVASLMGIVAIALIIFGQQFIELSAPGFSTSQTHMTATLLRFISIGQILLSISILASSVLQTLKSFFWPAVAGAMYNLGIIFGVIFLYPKLGFTGIGIGVVLGGITHLSIQLPSLFKAWGKPEFHNLSSPAKELLKLYLPRLAYLDIGQAGLFIATIIGSKLQSGTISTYTISYDLALAPVGIIALSVATASYPKLAEKKAMGEQLQFSQEINRAISLILKWMIPASVGLFIFRLPIIEILFQGGAFMKSDSLATASALSGIIVGLPALGILPLLTRVFWAKHESKMPLISTWASIVFFAVASFLFAKNSTSLSLVLSASVWLCVILMFVKLYVQKNFSLRLEEKSNLLKNIFSHLLQSTIAGLLGYVILHIGTWPDIYSRRWFIQITLAGLISLATFFLIEKIKIKNQAK